MYIKEKQMGQKKIVGRHEKKYLRSKNPIHL